MFQFQFKGNAASALFRGDPEEEFTMGESTGEIRVMGDMDREAREQYELVSGDNIIQMSTYVQSSRMQ